MYGSIEQVLAQVARRGSWVGGGSVAALGAALSAALLEKLLGDARLARRLRGIRRDCLRLFRVDAEIFARVIRATRTGRRRTFVRSLKAAIEVPCTVFTHARVLEAASRAARRAVGPRFQSDLSCAQAFARASGEAARGFIETNLVWLGDPGYARRIRRTLRARPNTTSVAQWRTG